MSSPVPPPSPPATAESLLLALARDLGGRAATLGTGDDVRAIVEALAAAYGPEAPLATALRGDWVRVRGDKTAELALAWAREQVRLALADVLTRIHAKRRARAGRDVENLAWLWLAACEALAFELPSAVPDRAHALAAFLTAADE